MSEYYTVDPKAMAELAESVKKTGGSGGGGEWLKMKAEDYDLRVLPPWSDQGLTHRVIRNHNGPFTSPFKTEDGYRVAPLCLRFLFSQEDLSKICYEAEKITVRDYDLFQEYGCPMDKLPEYYMSQDDRDSASPHWPRIQYLWNVLNRGDGKVYKYSSSQKVFTAINTQYKLDPDLFSPTEGRDFLITATGENETRRYSTPAFYPKPRAIPDGLKLYDLDAAMLKGVRTFDEIMWLVVNNNTNIPLEHRLTPALIGYAEEINLV